MRSYEYGRRLGVEEISWERFLELCAFLAEELDRRHIDTIVGIARAGLLPATVLACSLRRELLPVRLSRREQDEVVTERPVWKVDLSPEVAGRRIAIVDEMADTGETLALASQRARELGAAEVLTVALISHSWADPAPEVSSLVTDALVVFPWDRRILMNGQWQLHPELAGALAIQPRPGMSDTTG